MILADQLERYWCLNPGAETAERLWKGLDSEACLEATGTQFQTFESVARFGSEKLKILEFEGLWNFHLTLGLKFLAVRKVLGCSL